MERDLIMGYTTFTGKRTKTGCRVLVNEGGDASANLPLYLGEVNHSPTGFEWGYYGSGPSQLAYAIVRYLFGKMLVDQDIARRVAESCYMDFKREFIGDIHADEWTLTEKELEYILARYKMDYDASVYENFDENAD